MSRNKIMLGLAILLTPALGFVAALVNGLAWLAVICGLCFGIAVPVSIFMFEAAFPKPEEGNLRELVSGPRDRLGIRTAATVERVKPTGRVYHHVGYELQVNLTVEPESGSPYQATADTVVPVNELDTFKAGKRVVVRVDRNDPTRLAIDPNPPVKWLERINRPKPSPLTPDEILATGAPAVSQIVSLTLTGKVLGQVSRSAEHPERNSWPTVTLELMVQPKGTPGFANKAIHAVPPDRLAGLSKDELLPVRYVDHAGTLLVAVDWSH